MSDTAAVADSAPAPEVAPEVTGAPIAEVGTNFNAPLGSQIPPEAQSNGKPEKAEEPKSIDASIDRAIAKSAAAAKEPKPDAKTAKEPAKVEAKPEQPRENGKFVSTKPAEEAPKPEPAKGPVSDPPARFSEDAKAIWKDAPEPIRRETERAIKELTQGHEKYKTAAERDASLNDFHELAKKHGTDVRTALLKYTGLENLLRQDLVKGLAQICENSGVSIKDVAAHILGQTPDQNASQQDATIRELRQELAAVKQQIGGVTQTIQHQRQQTVNAQINDFAADHPRLEELSEDIAMFMETGRAKNLADAYALAERLNPAPASAAAPAASSAAPDLSVQPDKGQKSINGAPSLGSSPAGKKRIALSIDESLDRAFGRAG